MRIQLAALILLLSSAQLPFSQTANIQSGFESLCSFINAILPGIVMVMVVGAAGAYAGGQIFGAETRARANVWATSMLVGAIIGILIVVAVPPILQTMYDVNWNVTCAGGEQQGGEDEDEEPPEQQLCGGIPYNPGEEQCCTDWAPNYICPLLQPCNLGSCGFP